VHARSARRHRRTRACTQPRAPTPLPITAPKPIADLVARIAPLYQVPPHLVLAIMQAESNFDAAAVSPKNAQGLMQLIPRHGGALPGQEPVRSGADVRGGSAYLRWLLAYFEGDVALVAAAYNAGEGTVERYRGVPPSAKRAPTCGASCESRRGAAAIRREHHRTLAATARDARAARTR